MQELFCKNCGGSLQPISEEICKCENCGSTYAQVTAKKQQELLDSFLEKQKQEQLNSLRRHLWQEVSKEYIDNSKVLPICSNIKSLYPTDFLANFYEVICGEVEQDAIDFINSINVKENYDLLEHAINFLIKSLKPDYLLCGNNLIERAYKQSDLTTYNRLTTAFAEQAKLVEDGVYELNIPREVFIAYSSADMPLVEQLTSALEEQGISCFVAMRNLQHGAGAVDNYQRALETAIDNCKMVVFISSKNSRNLKCDAIKHELPYLKKSDLARLSTKFANLSYDKIDYKYKKPRIQWRVDDTKSVAVDKIVGEIFCGLEYCYNIDSVLERIGEYLLNDGTTEADETQELRAQLEEQNKKLANQLEEQEKRLREQEERLKNQGSFIGGYNIDEILAKAEERQREKEKEQRKQEQARKLEEQRKQEQARKLEEQRKQEQARKLEEQRKQEQARKLEEQRKQEQARKLEEQRKQEQARKLEELRDKDCFVYTENETGYIIEEVKKEYKNKTSLVIPNEYNNKPVTSIGNSAFDGCSSLKSVKIPSSVVSIQGYAFSVYRSITNILVDDNNKNYKSINGNLYTKDGKTLVKYAVGKKDNSFTIPAGVTSIGDYAFGGYFWDCTSLTSVVIPDSVTSIGNRAFQGCSSLTSVVIPDSVTSIGNWAFQDCTSLTSIEIPDSVTLIGDWAFQGCTSLTSITVSEENEHYSSLNGNLYNKNKTFLITYPNGKKDAFFTIPSSVTSIGKWAFDGCSSLTSVEIGDSVTSIGDHAFDRCTSLTSVVIPSSVMSIGDCAFGGCFWGCTSLTIYCKAKKQPQGWHKNWNDSNRPVYWYSEKKPFLGRDKYWHYVNGVPTKW